MSINANFKRETSVAVSDLHLRTVSDSIKRLAISDQSGQIFLHSSEGELQEACRNEVDSVILEQNINKDNENFSIHSDSLKKTSLEKMNFTENDMIVENPGNQDVQMSNNNGEEGQLSLKIPSLRLQGGHVFTVMSAAKDDFFSKYEIGKEIGKGGFSMVYQCRERSTGIVYAVKVRYDHRGT